MGVGREPAREHLGVEVVGDAVADEDGPAGRVARREALGACEEVGRDAVVVDGEPAPRAPEAREDLVVDEQDPWRSQISRMCWKQLAGGVKTLFAPLRL
jgi:hypothetical protein